MKFWHKGEMKCHTAASGMEPRVKVARHKGVRRGVHVPEGTKQAILSCLEQAYQRAVRTGNEVFRLESPNESVVHTESATLPSGRIVAASPASLGKHPTLWAKKLCEKCPGRVN